MKSHINSQFYKTYNNFGIKKSVLNLIALQNMHHTSPQHLNAGRSLVPVHHWLGYYCGVHINHPRNHTSASANVPPFFSLSHDLNRSCDFLVPSLSGDIQIGMEDKKGQLEVEVIRARSLTQKPGSKSTPGKEK